MEAQAGTVRTDPAGPDPAGMRSLGQSVTQSRASMFDSPDEASEENRGPRIRHEARTEDGETGERRRGEKDLDIPTFIRRTMD